MRSFRTRLAFLSALITAVILAAFGFAGYQLTKRLLLESVDLQLAVPLDRISRDLHPRTDFRRVMNFAEMVHGDEAGEGRLLLIMFDNRRQEILFQLPEGDWPESIDASKWQNPHAQDAQPPEGGPLPPLMGSDGEFFPPPHHGEPPRYPGRKGGKGEKGDGFRGKGEKGKGFPSIDPETSYHFVEHDSRQWRMGVQTDHGFTVVLARDLEGYNAEMSGVFRHLFLAAPVILFVIAGGAWVVARQATAPLNAITEIAENISAHDLKERIAVKRGEYLEYANLIAVINGMLDRLEKGFSHAIRFSGDVSHELKTPLTVMQAELHSASRMVEPGSAIEESIDVISREAQRLKSITGSLMMLSQAESGRLQIKREKVSLSDGVQDLAEDAEILCSDKGIRVEKDIQPGIEVNTDQTLLHQALLNLVSNAIKYNEPNGWIRIELSKHSVSEEITFRIANSGPGIPGEHVSQIFERFYRVNKARDRNVDGFGLGLNLSKEIIALLGGELELLKASEEETLFQVRLPG